MFRPRTRDHGHVYWPALDGVRAVAVSVVVAYHLGYLPGGWLGVDVFFVLSGYLITTLLLADHERTGSVVRAQFWARRAKRLLPAVFLLLVVLAVYARLRGPGLVPDQLRSPALATFLYVANWQQLVAGHGYFAQFTAPTPLVHTWSLAIEEQYYLAWPVLLAIGLAAFGGGGRTRSRRWLVAATVVGAAASAAWMGIAAHLLGANRAYLGTDTRAWELLIGGAAAMLWPAARTASREGRSAVDNGGPGARSGPPLRWALAPLVGAAVLGGVMGRAGGPPGWIWDGGLVAAGLGSAAVIVGVQRAPRGPLARVLSVEPLPWLGRISYSLYLWHWPAIVLIDQTTTGLAGGELLAARCGAMLAATCASYYLVETPLRRADWGRWWRRALVPAGAAATAGLVLAGTAASASAGAANIVHPAPDSSRGVAAGHVPEALPPGRVPSAADPLRVWILGDSVMFDSSLGLTAALQATGDAAVTANSSFGGWGLSTDKVWPADARRIIAQYRPEVVIGTWSWDDQLAAADPAAYETRLRRAVATVLSPGDGVDLFVLLRFPPQGPAPIVADPVLRAARWKDQLRIQEAWDRAAEAVARQFPGHAAYLSVQDVLAPGGRFMTWMRTASGTWIRARKLDNTHMCPYGAALFGQAVEAALQRPLSLGPPREAWETGPWTTDGRYNDPPGACPADQPPAGYTGIPLPRVAG